MDSDLTMCAGLTYFTNGERNEIEIGNLEDIEKIIAKLFGDKK